MTYLNTFESGDVKTKTAQKALGASATLTSNGPPDFPVGLMVEYHFRRYFEHADNPEISDLNTSRHLIGAGLYYTGREDLMLGLFASSRLWRGADAPKTYIYGQIVMQYFF